MAKILLGATLADARGSVGGATYTKGRFGAVLRLKTSPVQPRTSKVLVVRSFFAELSKRWFGTLVDSERLAWTALAIANPRTNAFGNSITLTGLQLYQSINRNLQNAMQATIDTAPANLDVDAITSITPAAAAGAGTFSVAFAPDPVPAGHAMVIEATLQVNAGRSFVSGFYRKIHVSNPAVGSPVDIHAEYIAIWGALRAGQKIGVRAKLVSQSTGAASVPYASTITVAA